MIGIVFLRTVLLRLNQLPSRKSLFNTFVGVNGIYGLKLLRKTEVHLENMIKTTGSDVLDKQLNAHMMVDIGRGMHVSREKGLGQNTDIFSNYYFFIPRFLSIIQNGVLPKIEDDDDEKTSSNLLLTSTLKTPKIEYNCN